MDVNVIDNINVDFTFHQNDIVDEHVDNDVDEAAVMCSFMSSLTAISQFNVIRSPFFDSK